MPIWRPRRAVAAAIALAAVLPAVVLAPGTPATAADPVSGGTLHVVGGTGVDQLDPNLMYFSADYAIARAFSRQLYSYPAVAGRTTTVEPDLATAMPTISKHGTQYDITLRSGARWDTSPARQITASDVARGVEITCNPASPFGGLPDFESLIKGMAGFCDKFLQVPDDASAIAAFLDSHSISGVQAVDDLTVRFTLTHASSYFTQLLALPALSPRPVELDQLVPGSDADQGATIADGPYAITGYQPGDEITLARNPAWQPASDPLRHAYVDAIDVQEDVGGAEALIEANDPSADVGLDVGPSFATAAAAQQAHDPRLATGPSLADNPYLVFNTQSPTSHDALRSTAVRRALSYALNRSKLVASMGAHGFETAVSHILPPATNGYRKFDDYPHRPAKARSLLKTAKHVHPKLTLIYPAGFTDTESIARAVTKELAAVGVTVVSHAINQTALYTSYLELPSRAKSGKWDLAMVGWGPDWYADPAASYFLPLFDGRALPPESSNFGLFDNRRVSDLIDQAVRSSKPAADKLWAKADRAVMSAAAVYPIAEETQAVMHSSSVSGFVLLPALDEGDYTNVWLAP